MIFLLDKIVKFPPHVSPAEIYKEKKFEWPQVLSRCKLQPTRIAMKLTVTELLRFFIVLQLITSKRDPFKRQCSVMQIDYSAPSLLLKRRCNPTCITGHYPAKPSPVAALPPPSEIENFAHKRVTVSFHRRQGATQTPLFVEWNPPFAWLQSA